jgi:hypothetical protein
MLSIEWRLREAGDILAHIVELLDDMNDAVRDLVAIVSDERTAQTSNPVGVGSMKGGDLDNEEEIDEETELLEEVGACVTRLFRVSDLIRQASATDPFTKALCKDRYLFSDNFDIVHAGEKFPKLASADLIWLRSRLGHAITQRQHYLSYIRDHRNKLALPEDDDDDEPGSAENVSKHAERLSDETAKASTLLAN